MEIHVYKNVPDSTYFRTSEAEPDLKEDGLWVVDGNGSRRSWGTPGVNSTVVLNDKDLTSIHVGFHHKHGGSQFWRHYKNGSQVKWVKLSESDKLRILDAYSENAPSWANIPGKLKSQYKIYQRDVEYDNAGNIIAYKYLRMDSNGKFYSIVDNVANNVCWDENHLIADQIPTDENTNGIYCSKVANSDSLIGYKNYRDTKLVKIMLAGVVLEFDYGYRAEEAYILEVLS